MVVRENGLENLNVHILVGTWLAVSDCHHMGNRNTVMKNHDPTYNKPTKRATNAVVALILCNSRRMFGGYC